MGVKFNSSGGGSVTLDAPSTASNLTVTLPSASGTLVSTGSPFSGGTANGVVYLNGSSVPTTGSALTFTSTGLGIGTSSPLYKLDVSLPQYGFANFENANAAGYSGVQIKDPNQPILQLTDGTNNFQIYGGGTQVTLRNYASGPMVFMTNSAERMRIDSSGNLLIGATSTVNTSKLYVNNGNATFSSTAINFIVQDNATNYCYAGFGANNGSVNLGIGGHGATANAIIFGVPANQNFVATTTNNSLYFGTNSTARMMIDTSGNVGIGTSSPASKVQITGGNTFSQSGLLLGSAGVASGYIWSTDNIYVKPNTSANTASGYFSIMDFSEVTKIQMYSGTGSIGIGGASAVTSGTGITFPATQSASSDANTLDDYEEGTWTPAFSFGTSGSVTYNTQAARYTKVGNMVTATFWLQIGTVSSPSGTVTLTGLPFTAESGSQRPSPALRGQNLTGATGVVGGIVNSGGTTISLALYSNGLAPSLQGNNFQIGSEVGGTICYLSA